METISYEERQSFPAWILVFCALILIAALVPAFRAGRDELWAVALVAVVTAVTLWLFARFHVIVTNHDLRFGFRVFERRLPLERIQIGEIRDITFWHGIGIHYLRGTAIWNAKLGRGLQVSDGKRRYLVGSDQPERLQSVLYERKAAMARTS
ncbi:MAG: DUF3093 family protein [bacterium]|nr:DUF3093 family protein [bacterium]